MSLLEGRHTVFLTRYEETTPNEWGVRTRVPTGHLYQVRCTVQWQNAQETVGVVPQPNTAVKVIALDWPGKPNDHFTWQGREFEQVGPALSFDGSPTTAHYEILARVVAETGEV